MEQFTVITDSNSVRAPPVAEYNAVKAELESHKSAFSMKKQQITS